jgi:hypothetical protein
MTEGAPRASPRPSRLDGPFSGRASGATRSARWTGSPPRCLARRRFQLYVFNTRARPVLAGTDGVWLAAKDRATVDKAIVALG